MLTAEAHVDMANKLGFKVLLGPPFDNRKPGPAVALGPEELFEISQRTRDVR
jgi:hypothetical protein